VGRAWLLDLITHALLCKNVVETIVSDDDRALNAAFASTTDDNVRHLNRIICVWHKMKVLADLLKVSGWTEEERETFLKLFRRMVITRDPAERDQHLDDLMQKSTPTIKKLCCLISWKLRNPACPQISMRFSFTNLVLRVYRCQNEVKHLISPDCIRLIIVHDEFIVVV
jgi:hypothetical protein